MLKEVRLLLLRHGNTFKDNETPYQIGYQTDLPLTQRGLEQASLFAAFLKKQAIVPATIYSGSLQRQQQTAHLLWQSFPQANFMTNTFALNEIDYGKWEGLTANEIQKNWLAEHRAWEEEGKWPENIFKNSLAFHLNELKNWLNELCYQHTAGSTIVAISSNGIFRLLLRLITNDKLMYGKVKTGHYCDLQLKGTAIFIQAWNCSPPHLSIEKVLQ